MPKLLKNDSVRLIEASIEALGLAQMGICNFRKDILKNENVRYSPEIGLIGVSIELAMNSVLIQAYGRKIIFNGERYKTASEILSDFRKLLQQSSASSLFLVNGVNDGYNHIKKILELTSRFNIIITNRANGLHNGMGLSYKVIASLFMQVNEFLTTLSLSNNYKPYLQKIPELVGISIDKNLLIDELYSQFNNTNDIQEQNKILSSLFLILPEVPKELPDWLSKFNSFNIAPKKNDVVYLINALENANPVNLKKVNEDGRSLSVVIRNEDPNAIPISNHLLKTEFTQFKDQFYSDISTANGRLKNDQLDLPQRQSIFKVFSLGFIDTDILEEGKKFTGQQAWSLIVSAISVPKNNTTAPFWFIIRNTDDLGQLKAQLKKAAKLGNKSLKSNIEIVIISIDKIIQKLPIDVNATYFQDILSDKLKFENHLEQFEKIYRKNIKNPLPSTYNDLINGLFDETIHVSDLISQIIDDVSIELNTKKYWISQLSQILPEKDDLIVFENILNMNE